MIRGDFSKLNHIVGGVARFGNAANKARVTKKIADEAMRLVREGFRTSSDPYGVPWKPTTARKSGKPLVDTGRLRNAFVVVVRKNGFIIRNPTPYAGTHQYGATIRAKRGGFLVFEAANWSAGGSKSNRSRKPLVFAKQVTIPARKMVPDGGRKPMRWVVAFRKIVHGFLFRFLR